MGKTKATTPSRITRESLKAGPGWVIIEPVESDEETVSDGGIVMPQNKSNNPSLISTGRVVSAGHYISKRSGALIFGADWLKPGDLVHYIPHNPWTLPDLPGTRLQCVLSDDIVTRPEQPKEKPRLDRRMLREFPADLQN